MAPRLRRQPMKRKTALVRYAEAKGILNRRSGSEVPVANQLGHALSSGAGARF